MPTPPLEFAIGDVVMLALYDNAREMTVAEVSPSGQVRCRWFVDAKLREAVFDATELELC